MISAARAPLLLGGVVVGQVLATAVLAVLTPPDKGMPAGAAERMGRNAPE
jgi:hypothetical protein